MIRFSEEEGFIKSTGIKNLEGERDENLKLPHVAVGVFSQYLFEDIVEKNQSTKIGYFGGAGHKRDIFILNYKGVEITFFMAGISGPWIAADIEELSYNGVDTFIIFGNCGVLDRNIEDCSIIIPNKAFREEGTSYHYLPDSETVDVNVEFKDVFKEILKENDFSYTEGATWTTDAFFRETKDKIDYFKSNGAVCVEMEGATIAAVCKAKELHHFTFYYAGDNLDAKVWDKRSLSQLTNFEKKQMVPKLALDLAIKIN